jgi:hypothetical protein
MNKKVKVKRRRYLVRMVRQEISRALQSRIQMQQQREVMGSHSGSRLILNKLIDQVTLYVEELSGRSRKASNGF